ncbi:Gfo/Idh/MocA family oxidoreductase [bacterium]|nr:Gfo/Idh/MocA family oxidoreductase [bacterium]
MVKQSSHLNRRHILKTGAAATAGLWITSGLYAAGAQSPNDKLNIGVIGIGGQGRANLNAVSRENIVALCDVDDERAGDAYDKHRKAKKYYDFRRMLDEMDSQLDAVVVSTPDHAHFHPAMKALGLGKHLYCEKPLAHSVAEIRAITNLARQKKLATQLGVQRHTIPNVHRVIEIIQSGAIGEVREVFSKFGGDRGMPPKPTEFPPVPEHLKWDLWLGPTKERKYSPEYCPYKWRFWWDFGTGETGNWGCHILDLPYWALKLEHCTKVSAWGPEVDADRTPKSLFAKYEFPKRGDLPPVTLHWYHTNQPVKELQDRGIPQGGNNIFIGSKGVLVCDFDKRKLYPEDKFADFNEPEQTIPDSPGFRQEWINACKGGAAPTCNFDYSGPMAETVILGNTAFRAGKDFDWQYKTMTAVGCPQAEPYLRPTFRKGWPQV